MENLSDFFAKSWWLRGRFDHESLDHFAAFLMLETDLNGMPLHKTLTGSTAEFYIKTIDVCTHDIDLMMYTDAQLAFDDDLPTLPKNYKQPKINIQCFKLESYEDQPGYVRLRRSGDLKYLCTRGTFIFLKTTSKFEFLERYIPQPLYATARGPFCKYIARDHDNQDSFPHGPSAQTQLSYNTRFIDCDEVFCIRCPHWPSQAEEWPLRMRSHGWPPEDMIRRVVEGGCDVVAVAHPDFQDDPLQWRFSFSRAEVVLLNSWTPVQQVVYHMLRCFAKRELIWDGGKRNEKAFCNYHVKTLVLWACESRPKEWWDSFCAVILCSVLLGELRQRLIDRKLPNYFLSQSNILNHDFEPVAARELETVLLKYSSEISLSQFFERYYIRGNRENFARLSKDIIGSSSILNGSGQTKLSVASQLISCLPLIHQACDEALSCEIQSVTELSRLPIDIRVGHVQPYSFNVYMKEYRFKFDEALFDRAGACFVDYSKSLLWLNLSEKIKSSEIPCDRDCALNVIVELLPASESAGVCPCESKWLREKRRKIYALHRKSLRAIMRLENRRYGIPLISKKSVINKATIKGRSFVVLVDSSGTILVDEELKYTKIVDEKPPWAASHREQYETSKTFLDKAEDILLCMNIRNLTGIDLELMVLLSLDCLKKCFLSRDKDYMSTRCPALLCIAALFYHREQYSISANLCSIVIRQERTDSGEAGRLIATKHRLKGKCLLFLDDFRKFVGFFRILLLVKQRYFKRRISRKKGESSFHCSAFIFANYLMTLCEQRASKTNLTLGSTASEERVTALDVYLTSVSSSRNIFQAPLESSLTLDDSISLQEGSGLPKCVFDQLCGDNERLLSVLMELSLRHLFSFFALISPHLGVCCAVEPCYRALYLYGCKRYEETLRLCDGILEHCNDDSNAEVSILSHVFILSPLDAFFDIDIQSLNGLYALCQACLDQKSLSSANVYLRRAGYAYHGASRLLVPSESTYSEREHFVGARFLAYYLRLRCLMNCGSSIEEIYQTFRNLKGRLFFERVIEQFMRQTVKRL